MLLVVKNGREVLLHFLSRTVRKDLLRLYDPTAVVNLSDADINYLSDRWAFLMDNFRYKIFWDT